MGIDSRPPWIILPLNGATQRKMAHVCGGFSLPLPYGVSQSKVKSKIQDKILPFKLTWLCCGGKGVLGDAEQSCVHKLMETLCSRSGRYSLRTLERYHLLRELGAMRDVSFLRGSAIRCGGWLAVGGFSPSMGVVLSGWYLLCQKRPLCLLFWYHHAKSDDR